MFVSWVCCMNSNLILKTCKSLALLLVEVARRTNMSIKKPSKGLTSQAVSTPRQP